jgi:hypothetical protein
LFTPCQSAFVQRDGTAGQPRPQSEQLAALAARHSLPAIFSYREFALAGGLMSYNGSVGYLYHQEAGGPACHPTDQI